LLPNLSVFGASLALPYPRFQIPFIKPDVRFSRIRLSFRRLQVSPTGDWTSFWCPLLIQLPIQGSCHNIGVDQLYRTYVCVSTIGEADNSSADALSYGLYLPPPNKNIGSSLAASGSCF
jgi:hypothetical protein